MERWIKGYVCDSEIQYLASVNWKVDNFANACKEFYEALKRYVGFDFQEIIQEFSKYFIVGGVAALTEWASYSALIFFLRWNYLVAAVFSFVIATGVNYVLSIRFVFFHHRLNRKSEITLVYIVSIFGAVINLGALAMLVEWGDVDLYLAKIMATGIAFLWNFFSRRYWIFCD